MNPSRRSTGPPRARREGCQAFARKWQEVNRGCQVRLRESDKNAANGCHADLAKTPKTKPFVAPWQAVAASGRGYGFHLAGVTH
jgi:hypothetical protein